MIILGDCNCVLDNELAKSILKKRKKKMKTFVEELEINDGWKIRHPSFKQYTWSKHSLFNDGSRIRPPSLKQYTWSRHSLFNDRRLDYILYGQGLVPFIKETNIQTMGFSDHGEVKGVLNF